jgi:hypothetical protein
MRAMEDGCAVERTCVATMKLLRPACRAGFLYDKVGQRSEREPSV